jgi:hypothetical protein
MHYLLSSYFPSPHQMSVLNNNSKKQDTGSSCCAAIILNVFYITVFWLEFGITNCIPETLLMALTEKNISYFNANKMRIKHLPAIMVEIRISNYVMLT